MINSQFSLRVATYNIRNITDLYCLRKKMFPEIVSQLNPDVIGLQEVSFLEYNQLDDLFSHLNKNDYSQYSALTQMNYGKANDIKDLTFNIDGNSICFRKSFENNSEYVNHQVLHLSPVRNAHCLSFLLQGLKIHFMNLHLHHVVEEENIRQYQMKLALKWIENITGPEDMAIIVGDFNALPNSETYKMIMNSGYISCHLHKHGREPEKTFHNKMDCDTKDNDEEGTFDYILYLVIKNSLKNNSTKHEIDISNVELYGMEESLEKKLIFASDHYALLAEIIVTVK